MPRALRETKHQPMVGIRAENSMERLRDEPLRNKPQTRRERERAARARLALQARDPGSWRAVTQAGVTFYVNDVTGAAEAEPPEGTDLAQPAPLPDEPELAEEVDDDDTIGGDSFAFLDDWSMEPTGKHW